jgi:hypothetical protein
MLQLFALLRAAGPRKKNPGEAGAFRFRNVAKNQ